MPRPAALRRGERAATIPRRWRESRAGPGAPPERGPAGRGGEGARRRGGERGAGPARRPQRKLPRSVTRTRWGRPGQAQSPHPGEGADGQSPGGSAPPHGGAHGGRGLHLPAGSHRPRAGSPRSLRQPPPPPRTEPETLLLPPARGSQPLLTGGCPPPPQVSRVRVARRRTAPRREGGSGRRRGRPWDVSALNGDREPEPDTQEPGGGGARPSRPPRAPFRARPAHAPRRRHPGALAAPPRPARSTAGAVVSAGGQAPRPSRRPGDRCGTAERGAPRIPLANRAGVRRPPVRPPAPRVAWAAGGSKGAAAARVPCFFESCFTPI